MQEEHNIPMTIELEKEMNDMCNLSAGIREEGERKGKLETIRNMIMDGLTTIDEIKATGRYTAEELAAVAASLR